jgi:hypothetical protein
LLKKLTNTPAQNRTNQNVRVQNDHFNGRHSCCGGALA